MCFRTALTEYNASYRKTSLHEFMFGTASLEQENKALWSSTDSTGREYSVCELHSCGVNSTGKKVVRQAEADRRDAPTGQAMLGILPMLWELNLPSVKAVEAENGDSNKPISFIFILRHIRTKKKQ